MPPLPTKTNVHGQRRQVLPTARVVRRSLCPASRAERAVAQRSGRRRGSSSLGRRLAGALVIATATVTLLLAVPPLRGVVHQISRMSLGWIAAALVLEIASCAAYVVIFRLFFAAVPAGLARQLAWTEEASGALLPTGGLGALAIGGWLLRQAGMSTRRIVESSSALFFLTSGMNVAALVVGGVMLSSDAFGGARHGDPRRRPDRAGSGVDAARRSPCRSFCVARGTDAGRGGWSASPLASKRPVVHSSRPAGGCSAPSATSASISRRWVRCSPPPATRCRSTRSSLATSSATSPTCSPYRAGSACWRRAWPAC